MPIERAQKLAEELYKRSNGENLYSERCLAIVYQGLGDYYAASPSHDRERNVAAAQQWYGKALAIWSRWRTNGIAVPYSATS